MKGGIWDRERDAIERDYADGMIGSAEAARLMREVDRDEREAAQEAAETAYRDTLDQWGGY